VTKRRDTRSLNLRILLIPDDAIMDSKTLKRLGRRVNVLPKVRPGEFGPSTKLLAHPLEPTHGIRFGLLIDPLLLKEQFSREQLSRLPLYHGRCPNRGPPVDPPNSMDSPRACNGVAFLRLWVQVCGLVCGCIHHLHRRLAVLRCQQPLSLCGSSMAGLSRRTQ